MSTPLSLKEQLQGAAAGAAAAVAVGLVVLQVGPLLLAIVLGGLSGQLVNHLVLARTRRAKTTVPEPRERR